MAAALRPLVSVQPLPASLNDMATDSVTTVALPDVMKASIRPDIVNYVHSNISKNSRQPYAVSKGRPPDLSRILGNRSCRFSKLVLSDAEKAKDSQADPGWKGKNEEQEEWEVANVERLNLVRLAPGGHLGRFVIWTKSAIEA
ncbi:hypothetical protein H0E87_012708 [Populus deltoides]|uniref:Uncharacterized protein n=1 Tax=Populus deltoides TaxID=3696 RepID=A0A8T2YKF0_POPDE|nr:hypothetical protein H0E87_012708 [Populus deltoides]